MILLTALAFLTVALLAATALVALAHGPGLRALLGAARVIGAVAVVAMYFIAIGRLL